MFSVLTLLRSSESLAGWEGRLTGEAGQEEEQCGGEAAEGGESIALPTEEWGLAQSPL